MSFENSLLFPTDHKNQQNNADYSGYQNNTTNFVKMQESSSGCSNLSGSFLNGHRSSRADDLGDEGNKSTYLRPSRNRIDMSSMVNHKQSSALSNNRVL
jgi:hypothetical protein